MIEICKKYSYWIIGVLFVLFCMKSCQSCSVERGRKWDKIVHTHQIDSMVQIQDSLNHVISTQHDSIIDYKYQIQKLNGLLERVEITNNYLRKSNQRLIDATTY